MSEEAKVGLGDESYHIKQAKKIEFRKEI